MPLKRITILRWTGRGSLRRLSSSIEYALNARGAGGTVSIVGSSIVVVASDPLVVAARMRQMPGVAWIAVGFSAESGVELARATGALARLYLRRGDRFSVIAEGTGGTMASDAGGAATSKILEAVKGSRVSESPRVRFRVAVDGQRGVVGVELREGAGGVPMGPESVACLVSGGAHSSVAAWFAVLAGFRVHLVHAKVSDESLLAAARLYAEISNRADARGIRLEVLVGGRVPGMLARYAARSKKNLIGGFHADRGPVPAGLKDAVQSPLYLMPEERFQADFESLGTKPFDSVVEWGKGDRMGFRSTSFGGIRAEVSDVLDGLR